MIARLALGACAAAIVSDNWPGLDSFFVPGEEILLPLGSDDVVRYLSDYDTAELQRIGRAAQARVLAKHTSDVRALEFEKAVEESGDRVIGRSGDRRTRTSGVCL